MQFITIDSIDDERVAAYTNLTEIQLRNRLEPERGLFIAESPKVIDRALAAGREPISLLVEEPWIEGMSQTFDVVDKRWGTDIPVYVASPEQLRQLTGYRLHRGALSAMRRWPLPSVEETCRDARRVAVMENIVDHTNVGALMRSAAAWMSTRCWSPVVRRPPVPARRARVHGHRSSRYRGRASEATTSISGRAEDWRNCARWDSPRWRWR